MESISPEMQIYLNRQSPDWHDHQRVLPWGKDAPSQTEIATQVGVDPTTVGRWQKAICPLPVEAAFRLAQKFGTQYLSYLAQKNNLLLIPVRHQEVQGPVMEIYANMQQENAEVLPLLAKADRGEPLTDEERMRVVRWKTDVIEKVHAIAETAMEKGGKHD